MSSKPTIDSAAVRDLATLLDETGLSEIEYETENVRIRVARGGVSGQTIMMGAPPAMPAVAPPAAPAPAEPPTPAAPASAEDAAGHPGAVPSPMVGVVYRSPEPGAAPFIMEGSKVAEGQTLLLIEAMKTFNPVRAPRAGTVTKIFADDAQAVEYGEPLCIIE